MQKKTLPSAALRLSLLAVAFVAVFLASFCLGRYPLSPVTVCRILLYGGIRRLQALPLLSGLQNLTPTWEAAAETVVLNVRLPRVLAAVLIGAALSVAGAAYQGMFRNPMVSPDILGASAGAGFGAATAIYLGFGYAMISATSFVFGLAAVLLAWLVSRVSRVGEVLAMVLSGMVISSLFSAATSFIKLIADTESVLPAITYWLMGSLSSIRMEDLKYAHIPILAGLILLFLLRWRLNLLTAGDEEARSMGVNTTLLRTLIILSATLVTAASVSISGMIGWVGLVIPHFCRLLLGSNYKRLIPSAMLMGSTFLLVVDNVSRLAASTEIPIGILTSFIGAPVFVLLLLTGGARD